MQQITAQATAEATMAATLEIYIFAACFAAGFALGIARTVRDHRYQSVGHIVSVGVCSGGLAFGAIVGLYAPSLGGGNPDWDMVGIAALVGLFGKEFESKIAMIVAKMFEKFGIADDE